MKRTYDTDGAERLVPYLSVAQKEIRERADAIRRLNERIEGVGAGAEGIGALRAALATHHREIRLVKRELSRLGCEIDENRPYRVLIPGEDGKIESGYSWFVGDANVRALTSDTAA